MQRRLKFGWMLRWCYSDTCSPGKCVPLNTSIVISVPQNRYHYRARSFPLKNISDTCFDLQSLLTVTEGFIVGLFFIQAPQKWQCQSISTMFDMKKDIIGISFCSGSLYQMLFFRLFLLVHMIIYLTCISK